MPRGRPKKSIFKIQSENQYEDSKCTVSPNFKDMPINNVLEKVSTDIWDDFIKPHGLTSKNISHNDIAEIMGLEHDEHIWGKKLPERIRTKLNKKLTDVTKRIKHLAKSAGEKSPGETNKDIVLRHYPDLIKELNSEKPNYKQRIRDFENNKELMEDLDGKVPSERTLRRWKN